MDNLTSGILRIGTSGIVLPGNKTTFPDEFKLKSRLNYYSSIFNSVEVNSSFYKVPMLSTFKKWSLDVSDDFQFTIKCWKQVTHIKNLEADLQDIALVLKAAAGIGNKKGCLLIQFPGKISMDYYKQVERVIAKFQEVDELNSWRKAIEFRSPTWYQSETFELLDEYGVAIVLHDMPKSKINIPNNGVSYIYVRYHGADGDYRGSYSAVFLQDQASKIKIWLKGGKDVYVYFNNTIGSAMDNAISLRELINQ